MSTSLFVSSEVHIDHPCSQDLQVSSSTIPQAPSIQHSCYHDVVPLSTSTKTSGGIQVWHRLPRNSTNLDFGNKGVLQDKERWPAAFLWHPRFCRSCREKRRGHQLTGGWTHHCESGTMVGRLWDCSAKLCKFHPHSATGRSRTHQPRAGARGKGWGRLNGGDRRRQRSWGGTSGNLVLLVRSANRNDDIWSN